MKKIAYIYQVNNKWTYAAKTVANGFQNAFAERGDLFKVFDFDKLQKSFLPFEKFSLINFSPDIIFTSAENVPFLPLNRLKSTGLVLWAPTYSFCDYEKDIHMIPEEAKKVLNKYSDKHNIVLWSQHEELVNEKFFSGYKEELGLKFIQLLHCADKTKWTMPLAAPEFDFLWVGNVGHRISTYKEFIEPLKMEFKNYKEYTEHNRINPEIIEQQGLYSKSCIVPNIHTEAQIKYNILLNERVFTSTMLGGFQICDNLLARQFFPEDELIIATEKQDFIEKTRHYIKYPQERVEMIKRMQANILKNHTYFNRIDHVLEALDQ